MKRIGRGAMIGAIAVVLFVGGGIGLFNVTRSSPPPPVVTNDTQSLLTSIPLIPSASLARHA